MLKRVNIRYSIDLDELPNEVNRIYDTAKNVFNDLSLPQESGKDILTADVLKGIDETRKKLARLDHMLSDVSGIVGSYVEYEVANITNNNQTQDAQDAEDVVEVS